MSDGPGDAATAQEPGGWAKYIREITDRPGWSVTRLARDADIRRSTIYRWLSGDVENVSINSIRAVAAAAGDDQDRAVLLAGDAAIHGADKPPANPVDAWEQTMVNRVYAVTWLTHEQQLQRIVRIRQLAAEQRALEDDLNRHSA